MRTMLKLDALDNDYDDRDATEWSEDCGKETFAPLASALPGVFETAAIAAAVAPDSESPIEVLFAVDFIRLMKATALPFTRCSQSSEHGFDGDQILLMHQYKWNNYRIDWAVKALFLQRSLFFIECDGRDFHSSDTQVSRDRQKDRLASEVGVPVFRFTGSDLERNAAACARMVFSAIENQFFCERHVSLRNVMAQMAWDGCHFKVELPVTLRSLASSARFIERFHHERGLIIRQGPFEGRLSDNRQFVRWYFEEIRDADAFRSSFGGRLICSAAA